MAKGIIVITGVGMKEATRKFKYPDPADIHEGHTPGKKVKINGLSHLYFDDAGKLYREDVYFNELDLLQQLGYSLQPPAQNQGE